MKFCTVRVDKGVIWGVVVGEQVLDLTHLYPEPGDVIATGTPGGVGFKRVPPVWLKPGDEVVVDGVGLLRNGVADEQIA